MACGHGYVDSFWPAGRFQRLDGENGSPGLARKSNVNVCCQSPRDSFKSTHQMLYMFSTPTDVKRALTPAMDRQVFLYLSLIGYRVTRLSM